MLRTVLASVVAIAAITLAGLSNATAEDKKAEKKTLEGKLVCTKCELKETKACGNALIVKEGDKNVTYYLVDKGGRAVPQVLPGRRPAKVTGKVGEKDGKKTIEDAKVEVKK